MLDSERIATLEGENVALQAKLAKLTAAAEALYRFDWKWTHSGESGSRTGWPLWKDLRDALGLDHKHKWHATRQIAEMRGLTAWID